MSAHLSSNDVESLSSEITQSGKMSVSIGPETRMNELLQGTIYLEEELIQTIKRLRSLANDLEGVCRGVAPSVPAVTVDEWFWGQKALPCLVGKVTGHPTLRGPYSATSQLFFLNQRAGLARTYTRWYRLGRPVIDHSLQ